MIIVHFQTIAYHPFPELSNHIRVEQPNKFDPHTVEDMDDNTEIITETLDTKQGEKME